AAAAVAADDRSEDSISDLESGDKIMSTPAPFAETQAALFAAAPGDGAADVSPTSATFAALLCDGVAGGGGSAPPAVLLARPQNYEAFPQPFSGLDVPVRPYERSNSRSSMGGWSFVGSEAGGGLEQQDDGGFMAGSMEGPHEGDGEME
ncbi:unnamed protein product, partial [Hapterophycus canaliculatus]